MEKKQTTRGSGMGVAPGRFVGAPFLAASVLVYMGFFAFAERSAAADAALLGSTLTPVGAERAGSADGRIPAWKDEAQKRDGWSWGKSRENFWKDKGEKPLYTITAANAEKYAQQLSPGQLKLLKDNPGFRMDVYPTHRSCGVPVFVADNTRKNVGFAKMNANGWAIDDAYLPGVPFPMPATGEEAMWNMRLRYRGVAIDWKSVTAFVSPRRGGQDWIELEAEQTVFIPWGKKGSRRLSEIGKFVEQMYVAYRKPVAMAGQAFVGYNSADELGNTVFYYFPGQRRVRRMPSYAYDAPQVGFENQYLTDEVFVFTGGLDRFEWKLKGKKEILVPYNSFGVADPAAKADEVVKKTGLESASRYELHRVWVIEATVKSGMRHVAPKRTFYLDEDSWNAVLAEDYDAQGQIAKVREGFVIPVYETGTCDMVAMRQHNLLEGRFVFDSSPLGGGADMRWIVDGDGGRYTAGFYTAGNLRAVSER